MLVCLNNTNIYISLYNILITHNVYNTSFKTNNDLQI